MQRWPVIIMVLSLLMVSGCGSAPAPVSETYRSAVTFELPTANLEKPEPTPINTLVLANITPTTTPTGTPIPDDVLATVVEVIDGQTVAVVLQGDGFSDAYLVRYAGISTLPRTPKQPWGVVAFETNLNLTQLKVVRLVRGEADRDQEGHLLRYLYIGDTLVNLSLVEKGLAEVVVAELPAELAKDFTEAEAAAKSIELGRWGADPTPTTAPERRPSPPSTTEIDIATSTPNPTPTITPTTVITNDG